LFFGFFALFLFFLNAEELLLLFLSLCLS
jgi:hypothetical protein